MFAFVLNATALGFVLPSFGLPSDFDEALFFLPILLALIGFAWLAYRVFVPEPERDSGERNVIVRARLLDRVDDVSAGLFIVLQL